MNGIEKKKEKDAYKAFLESADKIEEVLNENVVTTNCTTLLPGEWKECLNCKSKGYMRFVD